MGIHTSTNPYTQEINATFETLSDEQLTLKIEYAHTAFLDWKERSFAEKKELFYSLAAAIENNIEESAKLQTLEMGMTYSDSLTGLKGTANLARWFADNAEKVL